jgi:NAD(P)-dependent dehydrogenase (short-subunit alcohol dehydrogenase family)
VFDLSDQVTIVTGASRGLGKAMALTLADAGATVVLVARNGEALDEVAREMRQNGRKALAVVCDVTDEKQVHAMADKVIAECGNIDVLVNNAGVAWERTVLELTVEEIRSTFEVNVIGMFLASKAVGRHMVKRGKGKVINIGSVDGVVGAPNLVHYCASKGAVIQFTRALAAEWAKFNIQVNCLCPGYFPTEINMGRLEDEKIRNKVLSRIPLRRFGRPEELGPSVVYLASSATDYMTGQVVILDGGESAR